MRIKTVTGILIPLFVSLSCSLNKSTDPAEDGKDMNSLGGEISIEKPEHDLGTVMQGETVGYNFAFTNTGEGSLLILDASASCGCTVPRFSKEPVPPGGNGTVEVMFDTSGRIGKQRKTVTLQTNGKVRVVQLTIEANIIESN